MRCVTRVWCYALQWWLIRCPKRLMKNKTPGGLFSPPPPPPTPTVHTKSKSNMADRIAGGPRSSSCEVVILRKKSHGEVLRVCMGIFTTALRYNKDTVKFSTKILHLTSTLHRLLSDRLLCWEEPMLASYPFLGLLRTKEGFSRAYDVSLPQ